MTRITEVSDPQLYQSLYEQWIAERKPGWVVRAGGMQSWKVTQLVDTTIAFDDNDVEAYYESTGLSAK
jgi:hypothetical protein